MSTVNAHLDDERFDQFEGWVLPQPDGSWAYLLEAIAYHPPTGEPDDAALLAGLLHLPEASRRRT